MSEPTLKPVETGPSAEDPRIGQRVGRYRLDERIAVGGMGVVYRASRQDEGSGAESTFALKLLRPADEHDEERRRRFLREGRVVAALEHPGIVRVHEIGDADGEVFIVMDLVAGQNLRGWLGEARAKGQVPPVETTVRVARLVAEAVAYAHVKGIVHRDLKPDNVMIEPDEGVLVLDFGLAKMREIEGGAVYEAVTETSLTHEGRVLGTPGYMAPEQASGKDVGFRADVFALGAIVYEMLTATRPFTGATPMDVLVSVTRDQPPPPSSKNAAVGPELDALVARCLAKQAAERPTMEEAALALGRPSLTKRPAAARAPGSRSRWAWLAVVAVASVAIVAGVSRRAGRQPAPPATAESTAPALVPTAVTDLPKPASSSPEALAIYASALAHEREGNEDATLEELDRATQLDPDLAAAHLRLALRRAFIESERAHVHFAQAVKLRYRLSPRDQDVLVAAQPVFQRDPPDSVASVAGLRALALKWPGDAELAYELATAEGSQGNFAEFLAAAERAVTLDPNFGLAFASLAEAQAYSGKFDDALATVARCLALSPSATWCMWVREYIDSEQGRCSDASGRARIAIDPSLYNGYLELFFALTAKGEATPGAQEALEQVVRRIKDPFRARRMELALSLRLAALRGDFVAAMTHADQLRVHLAPTSDTSQRAVATILSAEVAVETGHRPRAAALAKEFLERHDVWQSAPIASDYSLADDSSPVVLAFAYHAGVMPKVDYERALGTWRAKWDGLLRGRHRAYLWVYGTAAVVETPEEGKEALAAFEPFSPLPPFIPYGSLPYAAVGRTMWLGGREAEGIEALAHAAHSCWAGANPIPWMHAHAWLAEALAKRGDVEGACRENDVVLTRWGKARPASVTADAARARARALGCNMALTGR
jgi:eukaryotic-like serine/threonine-protein kinase